jgi:hypothetical protein
MKKLASRVETETHVIFRQSGNPRIVSIFQTTGFFIEIFIFRGPFGEILTFLEKTFSIFATKIVSGEDDQSVRSSVTNL